MKFKRVCWVGTVGAICAVAGALVGLPLADASSSGSGGQQTASRAAASSAKPLVTCVHFLKTDPEVCGVRVRGPQGARGPRGATGPTGRRGATGHRGKTGPRGMQGPRGKQGQRGRTGAQGIQGAPGNTVVVAGTEVSVTAPPGGEPIGTEPTPTVAECTSAADPEAYGGGVQIQKSGQESTGDVVTIASQYAGTYVSSLEVDPLPAGATSGTVSTTAANAYLGQAVITELAGGDTVTMQAFVVCGP